MIVVSWGNTLLRPVSCPCSSPMRGRRAVRSRGRKSVKLPSSGPSLMIVDRSDALRSN
ncbi:hypothetical protein BDA96_01G345400 [Sorghum bicolor]|uniref:Uncharacterized protein n=1 Tax=Sorghum bicolor TaxID=4558 RepID=A0A921S1Y3_SORBI|nr:hypothetical protein BDA96_01G345400 [Sorghum bicolor]